MTTMTLNISDMNILENLKQMLSSMTGVEIVNVSEQANNLMVEDNMVYVYKFSMRFHY